LNAFAENEKSKANVQTIPPDAQSQDVIRDEAQANAERDRRIQEFRAPDPTTARAGRLTAPMAAEFGQSEDVWQSGISCGGG